MTIKATPPLPEIRDFSPLKIHAPNNPFANSTEDWLEITKFRGASYVVSYNKRFFTVRGWPVTFYCNFGNPEDCIYLSCPSDSVWMVPPTTYEV